MDGDMTAPTNAQSSFKIFDSPQGKPGKKEPTFITGGFSGRISQLESARKNSMDDLSPYDIDRAEGAKSSLD